MSRGTRGSFRGGFFFGVLSFGSTVLIGFVSSAVTARIYGIDVIGQFALVGAPVAALWVLSSVKEQQAMIKEITGLAPRAPRVTQLFAVVFGFSFLLTLVVSGVAAGVCCWLFPGPFGAPELLAPALVLLAGYVLVINTAWNFDSVLAAFVAGRQLFWVRLHESVSFLLIACALGLAWGSVWGLVFAMIGASFTSLVHRVGAARHFVRFHLNRAELRAGLDALPELLRFGLKATPGQIAQGASGQGGVWALGIVAPISVVGAYSRAQMIPKNLQQASMRITEVLYPTLVGRRAAGDGHGFDRALIDSIRYEVIGMLGLAAAIGGAAHTVLGLFGPGFDEASSALVLLAISPAAASVTVTQTQALWATDHPGYSSVIAIARLLVTVALLIVLTPWLGIIGPAIALLLGYGVIVVMAGLKLRSSLTRPLRASWPVRQRLVLVAAYAAGFLAANGVERLASGALLALPACLVAGVLGYLAALLLLGGVNERDRERVAELAGRLAARCGEEGGIALLAQRASRALAPQKASG